MGIFSIKKNTDTSTNKILEELGNELALRSCLAPQQNRLFGKMSTDAVVENNENNTVYLLKFDWDVNSVHFGSVMHLGRIGNEARAYYFNKDRQTTVEGSESASRTVKSLLFVKTKNGKVGSYSSRIKDISERIGVTIFYVSGVQEVADILIRLSQEEPIDTQY